ncbi:Hypothetical predicted protein [Mytilus galloprovincialis]|uniref:Uncharacterized protein n=1 Tax=Mytilus galloprovincialis TaxID=29158 RepID=A0A8B6HMU3_MYTGA|nr:Hypothetical predicted protein [Mytilus galloprovincialis]
MKQYLEGAPLELVALDILGPLPITTSGKKRILVLTDYFSRWAEAYPIPNQEAETICVDEFICRFDLPRQVHINQAIAGDHHPKLYDAAILHSDYTTICWKAHFTDYYAIASDHHPKFFDAVIFYRDSATNYCTAYDSVNSAIASDHRPMFCDAATFYRDSATNFTVTTQPAAGKPTTQSTKPLPVTITKSSVMQPYFTVTHNQLLNSQFTVYSAIASDHHPKFCDAAIHHSDYTTSCWRAHFTVN